MTAKRKDTSIKQRSKMSHSGRHIMPLILALTLLFLPKMAPAEVRITDDLGQVISLEGPEGESFHSMELTVKSFSPWD